MFETPNNSYPKTTGTVIRGEEVGGIQITGVKQNYHLYDEILQGMAIAPVEVDQLVRRIPLLLKSPDGWLASFGTQVLKTLTNTPTYIITTNQNGIQEIAVRGLPPVKTDSLGRKWISWVETEETDLQEMNVNGKFVFVGVTANGVMPQVATPVGLLEPHKIQAALAESIIIQDSPHIPDWSLALEMILFFTFVALTWAVLNRFGVSWGIISAVLLMVCTSFTGYKFIQSGYLIDVTWTFISQFNPELLKLGGERKYATFLFTDVRGFTSLSESVEPEQVTYIMNRALTAQQSAVQKHNGMVDKYIGDAMMAIFNAPLDLENHEDKAIQCAIDIQNNMEKLNKELAQEGLPNVEIGIGVNSGEAVIGNMGSDNRFDYTAIGDAVNTAARLESSTKEVGENLIIGSKTKQNSKFRLKLLKPIQVKGKKLKLTIYTV
jgi:adenylate cyclase